MIATGFAQLWGLMDGNTVTPGATVVNYNAGPEPGQAAALLCGILALWLLLRRRRADRTA